MPKSKEMLSDSDSDQPKTKNAKRQASNTDDDEDEKPTVTTVKKAKTNGKDQPAAKRVKTSSETDNAAVTSKKGSNGEQLYEIGKSRYISVSEFKGKPYVNIREYYDDKGVEKPGKKGISLPADQWEKLKSLVNQVDKDLKKSR